MKEAHPKKDQEKCLCGTGCKKCPKCHWFECQCRCILGQMKEEKKDLKANAIPEVDRDYWCP